MRHQIPRANWHMVLADAIDKAEPGDTIVCHTEEMRELGLQARARMCPDKELIFDLETDTRPA